VLAGIVFTIAVGMIDVKGLKDILSESAGEFRLALLTAAAVPGIGVEEGILFAIALSLVRHVRHSYRPNTMIVTEDAKGHWIPMPAHPGAETRPGLIVYRFGADLFYANADRFADETRALIDAAPQPVKWFVVDASAVTDIDFSAARTLRDLIRELAGRKIDVAFGRVSPSLRSDMERHGIAAILGEGRIFESLHEAVRLAVGGEAAGAVYS
jgi:MFS superfamily sulfate permease-like transporter